MLSALCGYLRDTLDFQLQFFPHVSQEKINELPLKIIHPLTNMHSTSQFVYQVLRHFSWSNNVYAVKDEEKSAQSSHLEVQVANFFMFNAPELNVRCAFTSEGRRTFPGSPTPDITFEKSQEAIFVQENMHTNLKI